MFSRKIITLFAVALGYNFLTLGSWRDSDDAQKNKQLFIAAREGDVAQVIALHADKSWRTSMRNYGSYVHVLRESFAAAYKTLHMARDMPDSELQATLQSDTDARYEDCNRDITPLDVAAIHGHVSTVDFLSRHSLCLGVGLLFALHFEHETVARILMGRREMDRNSDGLACYQKFATAVAGGNTKMVQIFLDNKCQLNPNIYNNNENPMRSVFHVAASRGHEAVLKQLIEYEYADMNPVDEVGRRHECRAALEPIVGQHAPVMRMVLEYKGVEEVHHGIRSGERVRDFVLPSMKFKDCEDLTALQYAQRRLNNADEDQEQHAKLAACVDLLQNQQAGFSNFVMKKYYKSLQS